MPETLYLIDGHAQIYRAYYARFDHLNSPSGEPTRATHVFFQMLLNLIRDRRPDYLVMVMDVSDKTVFRREIYADYKANRDPPPEDMPVQIDRIVSILEAVGVPILRLAGFEADDIIATLAHRVAAGECGPDLHVHMVSKDKDLEQLLGPTASMFDPGKNEFITHENLLEKKGWTPDQALEVQSLAGDTVDNIPGVKGIGPKTAAKLIHKYGTAQAVIDHADELTPKQRENVLAFAPLLEITRQLLTLRKDVPIEFDLAQSRCGGFDWQAARPIMDELGFRRLTEQLPGNEATRQRGNEATIVDGGGATIQVDYRCINTAELLDEFVGDLSKTSAFAFDTETTSIKAIDAELVGMSFAWRPGQAYYIPVRCMRGGALPLELVRERLAPIFAETRRLKVGQNLKYDMLVMRNAGMPVAGPLFDTMIASFVLDATRRSHGMDGLVSSLLGHTMIPISDLIGKGRDQLRMDEVPLEHVSEYAAEDADYTWRLKELFEPQIAEQKLDELFYKTEMPLVSVLADMEYDGISIDAAMLRKMGHRMATAAEDISERVQTLAGQRFNLDSPKQLGEIMFDKLEFRVVRKTKTTRSTDAETLDILANETGHELPKLLLEYRELQKLRGTYVDALPKTVSLRTGRIHTSYHQTGAVTGRLSSSEPNLQNIPVRTEQGREIRRAFVPRTSDELLIVADYSQIELRILAHFCQDEALLQAFRDDLDIHAFVAAQVNGVELADVTREMRSRAKAVNFGIIYGQTAFGLARTTGMSQSDARAFIEDYFARYPRIREFIDQCVAAAKEKGSVTTLLGRRRDITGLDSRNPNERSLAERLAVNTVIQGSAADMIKVAMVQLHRRIHDERLPLRMLLQVHDELVCESPKDAADGHARMIEQVMRDAIPLRVPVTVEAKMADNWLDAK